jgi:DNA-binding NarL/FixJ family response regulator
MQPLRIYLVDDNEVFLHMIAEFLSKESRFHVVGTANSGFGAIEQIPSIKPDIVLMDISMPVMNGIETTRRLLSLESGLHIVMLSMHADAVYRAAAKLAGAEGCIAKSEIFTRLVHLLQQYADMLPRRKSGRLKRTRPNRINQTKESENNPSTPPNTNE